MAERYLYHVSGEVAELPGHCKAVINFEVGGTTFRALLWSKNFFHKVEFLGSYTPMQNIIKEGDRITFHCHPYDKEQNPDSCEYFAARAWHSIENDEALTISNQQGRIDHLEHGKGVIQFTFFGKEEQVMFLRSKYYHFEHRISSKPLSEFLSLDDMVQFEATRCKPTNDNKFCSWIAKFVWKGKRPTNTQPGVLPEIYSVAVTQDGGSGSQGDLGGASDTSVKDEPKRLYQVYEGVGSERSGRGAIMALLSEEAAVALWMIAPNCWETVFFHRSVAYLDDILLSKYNLHESCPKDTRVEITAVPANTSFPCKWIARKVVISS